jgi:hypothetical protein
MLVRLKTILKNWLSLNIYLRSLIIGLLISLCIGDSQVYFFQRLLYNLFNLKVFITPFFDHMISRLVLSFFIIFVIARIKKKFEEKSISMQETPLIRYRTDVSELLFFKNFYYKLVTLLLVLNTYLKIFFLHFFYLFTLLHLSINIILCLLMVLFIVNIFRITRHEVNLIYDLSFDKNTIDPLAIKNKNSHYKLLLIDYFYN